jgi:hypothetical protein
VNKDKIVKVLLDVAEQAVQNSDATHVEDLANEILAAVEAAALTIQVLSSQGQLKREKEA